MNAKEFAHELEKAASFIRQQQAEIEKLKTEMSLNSYDDVKNVANQLLKVRIFRDINDLKIWGNDNGMRFLRDPDNKTKYKVYFTDDDLDKLEAFVRQQQAEIEDLKSANQFIQNFAEEQHKRAVALEMRELTDEELYKIYADFQESYTGNNFPVDLGKAILRKAQEK